MSLFPLLLKAVLKCCDVRPAVLHSGRKHERLSSLGLMLPSIKSRQDPLLLASETDLPDSAAQRFLYPTELWLAGHSLAEEGESSSEIVRSTTSPCGADRFLDDAALSVDGAGVFAITRWSGATESLLC
ncbi:hypothetical protein KC356_g13 [Hortaea werneckii]|nr:hypothetical protein KC356_g13 [Hortaea werneckii]